MSEKEQGSSIDWKDPKVIALIVLVLAVVSLFGYLFTTREKPVEIDPAQKTTVLLSELPRRAALGLTAKQDISAITSLPTIEGGANSANDAWNRPISYSVSWQNNKKRAVVLAISAGPDGAEKTEDDIGIRTTIDYNQVEDNWGVNLTQTFQGKDVPK